MESAADQEHGVLQFPLLFDMDQAVLGDGERSLVTRLACGGAGIVSRGTEPLQKRRAEASDTEAGRAQLSRCLCVRCERTASERLLAVG